MTEKIHIELSQLDLISFDFKEHQIVMMPYLNMGEQVSLGSEYLGLLFDQDTQMSERFFVAENALILQVIDILTNIDVSDSGVDLIVQSGLWEQIRKRIINYDSFRMDLARLVSLYQHQINKDVALGTMLEKITNQLLSSLENLSDLDLEELKNIAGGFVQELEKMNERIPGISGEPAKRGQRSKKTE